MTKKTVKQVVQNVHTGTVAIEYSDLTYKEHSIDDLVVAREEGGDIVLKVFGEDLPLATTADVAAAQKILTVSGDFVVGETLTATLADGWTGTYQWTRDGVNITDETAATYVLDAADEDTVVTCKATSLVYVATGNTVVAAPTP